MRKRALKYPSELNTKTVRINLGTYQLLTELATKSNLTIAEALDLVVTDRATKETVTVPRTQIPMPLTTAYQVITPLALGVKLQPTIATNGSKRAAFRIKTKGVRYE